MFCRAVFSANSELIFSEKLYDLFARNCRNDEVFSEKILKDFLNLLLNLRQKDGGGNIRMRKRDGTERGDCRKLVP